MCVINRVISLNDETVMDHALPVNQMEFENAVMEKFAEMYPEIGEILMSQFSVANVIDRNGSGVGCFTNFDVPAQQSLIPASYKSPLSGPNLRIAGIKPIGDKCHNNGPAGTLLFLEGGRLSMLECHSWTEGWPSDYYDYEFAPDIEVLNLDEGNNT